MENKNYKRQYRELGDDVKQKISQGLKHKSKSQTHKDSISQSMKDYWSSVPNRPNDSKLSPTETGEII